MHTYSSVYDKALHNIFPHNSMLQFQSGWAYATISSYISTRVQATDITLRCDVPEIQGNSFIVKDGPSLYSGIAAAQAFSNLPTQLLVEDNISLQNATSYWPSSVQLLRNTYVVGNKNITGSRPVVDWYGQTRLITISGCVFGNTTCISQAVGIWFVEVHMINLYSLNGIYAPGYGGLPFFTLAFWPVWVTG